MKKDPRVYLAHILECAQKIDRYTKVGEKDQAVGHYCFGAMPVTNKS